MFFVVICDANVRWRDDEKSGNVLRAKMTIKKNIYQRLQFILPLFILLIFGLPIYTYFLQKFFISHLIFMLCLQVRVLIDFVHWINTIDGRNSDTYVFRFWMKWCYLLKTDDAAINRHIAQQTKELGKWKIKNEGVSVRSLVSFFKWISSEICFLKGYIDMLFFFLKQKTKSLVLKKTRLKKENDDDVA